MACELMQTWVERQPAEGFGKGLCVRLIDGTPLQEPGATGSTWRIHYSIALPTLSGDEVHLTSPKVGESFQRFAVHPGDLFVGDRGFAHREGCAHVVAGGGEVLVRINLTHLPLEVRHGAPLPLLRRLRTLTGTRLGDWITHADGRMAGRLGALKQSEMAAERARRRVLREAAKKGRQVQPETLEAAGYIFVFTPLAPRFGPGAVLEIYRGRGQSELAFKRLKSRRGLGPLKKTDPQAAMAWVHGKLWVAFLIEALIAAGEKFFPWGYPLVLPGGSLLREGDLTHASPALECSQPPA
jgi:hypothetical protein